MRRLLLAAALAAFATPAFAQAPACTPRVPDSELIKSRTLVMSINPTLRPLQYVNAQGQLQGLRYELGEEIAKRLCLTPEWVRIEFSAMIPGLAARRWDMINTGTFMLRTADGYKYIAFGTSSLGLEKGSDYPPQLFDVEHDPDELDDLAAGGKAAEQVAKLDAILMSDVDYPAVDAVAKSVDHWLFDQWFVLAGHDQGGIEATWRKAYSTGRNFTEPEWEVEWGKAQRWMGLRLPRVRRLTRRPIS